METTATVEYRGDRSDASLLGGDKRKLSGLCLPTGEGSFGGHAVIVVSLNLIL